VVLGSPLAGARQRSIRCSPPRAVPTAQVPPQVRGFTSGGAIGKGALWGRLGNLPPQSPPTYERKTGTYRSKFPWYLIPSPAGALPTVTGKRLDGPGTFTFEGHAVEGAPLGGVAVSAFTYSAAGCWKVTARYRESRVTFRVRVDRAESSR
jgi:hypothetical protein